MKKFLLRLFFFGCFSVLLGEIIGHYYNLPLKASSVMVQDNCRFYKPNQSGVYSNWLQRIPWQVNEYGYLGVFYLDARPLFSIIGDSFIENAMNPITANQGYLLKKYFPQYGFIEGGIAAMNFFEAIMTAKLFNKKYQPDYHLIYVANDNDFYESISNLKLRRDLMQVEISGPQVIIKPAVVDIRGKFNKLGAFIFTKSKTAFFIYKKSPLIDKRQAILQWLCGRGGVKTIFGKPLPVQATSQAVEQASKRQLVEKLLNYLRQVYPTDNIILVFNYSVSPEMIELTKHAGFQRSLRLVQDEKPWRISARDDHWSIYGHNQVALQVKQYLETLLKNHD